MAVAPAQHCEQAAIAARAVFAVEQTVHVVQLGRGRAYVEHAEHIA